MLEQFIYLMQESPPDDYDGVFVVPTTRSPVTTSDFKGGKTLIDLPNTEGDSRAMRDNVPGLMEASGTVIMPAYPTGFMPQVIRSFLTNNDASASGTGFTNDLLPDDTIVQYPWFSIQNVYSSTMAQSIRGAVLSKWTLAAAAGALVTSAAEFVSQDISMVGGFWSDDVTAAPGVVGSSTLAPETRPFIFNDGQIFTGSGAISLIGNKISIASLSKIADLESFSLEVDLGVEGRPAICDAPPTINRTRHGLRKSTLTADVDWAIPDAAYWNLMQANTPLYLQIRFTSPDFFDMTGPKFYKMTIVLPRMHFPSGGGDIPVLDGTKTSKNQSITLESYQEKGIGLDIGIGLDLEEDLT
jgi:hypothetical protein